MTPATNLPNRNALKIERHDKVENNSRFADRIMAVAPLAPGDSVLEVGCGGAELSCALTDRYGLDCRGIEPFPMYAPCIDADRVRQGVAEALPHDDGGFDLVVAKDVLEHVDDVEQAVDELVRVSRRYVYVMCPNYAFPYEAHFKVPFPPFLPKPLARGYLRCLGFSRDEIGFLDHINYVTKAGLLRALRRSRHRGDILAVIDLQVAKRALRRGVAAWMPDALVNDKIELLIVKKRSARA